MNSSERVAARLRGEPVDRPPNFNIIMQFGAHYIGKPLSAYYQDYRVLCEANFAVRDAFDLDILQAISDPYREAADAGLKVTYPEDSLLLAPAPLLQEPGDLDHLRYPKPEDGPRMTDRLNAVRLLKERAGGQVPVMGWVEGALAEAADLRGVSRLMTDLIDRPEWVREVLERCVEVEIAFAVAQIEAGADIIGLGDAVASQISPRAYIIDLDWMVDMAKAAEVFGDRAAPCGNHDPVAVMLQGTPETVRAAVEAELRAGGPRCISMAGCEIPSGTPDENMKAHAAALREWRGGAGQ
ncbi:MAG: hypothetical protein MUC34_06925 [Anaerolineae bacterium]|nr:hypothetical protein [Anaerolineae bacterium]